MSSSSFCWPIHSETSSSFQRFQTCHLCPLHFQPFPFPFQISTSIFGTCNKRSTNSILVKSFQIDGGVGQFLSPHPLPTNEQKTEDGEQLVSEFEEDIENPYSFSSSAESKGEEEEDEDSSFKLRNGKEVLAEKAYLVGVEQKGVKQNSFGIEDSLKEFSQLADTAGLQACCSKSKNIYRLWQGF